MRKFKYLYHGLVIAALFIFGCGKKGCERSSSGGVTQKKDPITTEFNIILETSASMKGYITGERFKKDVTNFIAELEKISSEKDTTFPIKQLNYYTTNIVGGESVLDTFKGSTKEFSTEIMTGKIATGTTSPLDEILDNIINSSDSSKLNFLVSDFVMDIKTKQVQNTIQSTFQNLFIKAKAKGLGLTVYRMLSDYSGIYYPPIGTSFTILKPIERPYFIWVLGTQAAIKKFVSKMELSKVFKSENVAHLGLKEIEPNYGFMHFSNDPIGRIKTKDCCIQDISLKNGVLKTTLGFNLNNLPADIKDLQYLKNNLEVVSSSIKINNYSIYSHQDFLSKYDPKDSAYTHYIEFTLADFKLDTNRLCIRLKKHPLNWDTFSTNDCANLQNGTNIKTFCLKEILTGVQNAYGELDTNKYYFQTNLCFPK